MFSLQSSPVRLCDGVSRREWLRVGGLSVVGLSLADLLKSQAQAAIAAPGSMFGRAKNVMFLWLQGGPPQHETFDPKPDAPAEIRGSFQPISTNVPGIQFCELLPRIASMADKLAVVRSLHTDDNNHDVSGYWVLTGYPYGPGSARQIKPHDWPYLGSIVKMLKPSEKLPALSSVWIPDMMRLNDNVQPAGQTAGFLGPQWEPERFVGDPSSPEYKIEGLSLPPEIPSLRLDRRLGLLEQVERHFARLERGGAAGDYAKISDDAFGLLTSGQAREAFKVEREPAAVRERYGLHKWGQSLLLGRRLIEAGVRLVHVNWPREPGDTAVGNPLWDTHDQNADRLQDVLCPLFDVGFSVLLDDLEQRGLLAETLVVAIGEFGRTPKINGTGGRDHWGPVFCYALAGAGISGGQVYGASDKIGGYPAEHAHRPHDLTATIFHLLGIDHTGMFRDRADRPHPITKGEPLWKLIGSEPATAARQPSTGDVSLVPPYDDSLLLNVDFELDRELIPLGTVTRQKGWMIGATGGLPASAEVASDVNSNMPTRNVGMAPSGPLAVRLVTADAPLSRSGRRHVQIGLNLDSPATARQVPADAKAILTQTVRAPRAGGYTLSVHVAGGGSSPEFFRDLFQKHFACRLVFFSYTDLEKNPLKPREFAAVKLEPKFSPDGQAEYQRFQVQRSLRSQDGGAMETSRGVGVSVIVERVTPGPLDLPAGASAFVRIDDIALDFNPRPRDESVMV